MKAVREAQRGRQRPILRDSRRCIAYTPGVAPLGEAVAAPKASPPNPLPGRRRSATGREQARRKAWGAKWGAALKAAGKQLRDERG